MTWGSPDISSVISESDTLLPFIVDNKKTNVENKNNEEGLRESFEEDSNSKKVN